MFVDALNTASIPRTTLATTVVTILQEQLRHVHMEQCGANPLDAARVASLKENEAATMTRVTEKKVQMAVSGAFYG